MNSNIQVQKLTSTKKYGNSVLTEVSFTNGQVKLDKGCGNCKQKKSVSNISSKEMIPCTKLLEAVMDDDRCASVKSTSNTHKGSGVD